MDPVYLGNNYELIITSASIADATKKWRNTFGILQTSGTPAYADDIVAKAVEFMTHNQWHDSQVISAELRLWQRGDVPFEDQGYVWLVEGIDAVGIAEAHYSFGDSASADGDICLLVHKEQAAVGGRIGKLFLHNLIRASMIDNTVGGRPVFNSDGSTLPGLVTADAVATFGTDFFGSGADPAYVTQHWAQKPTVQTPFYRLLSGFTGIRLTEHQLGRGQ